MRGTICVGVAIAALLASVEPAAARRCRPDAVPLGNLCVDRFEASVWDVPATNEKLVGKIRKGTIRSASDLAAATRRGAGVDDYGAACGDDGVGCVDAYAVSVAGVAPSTFATWFQATAACRNAGKRLLTNAEWQAAALGTPDTGEADDGSTTCNTDNLAPGPVATGTRTACVSNAQVADMIGNVWEWVADWVPLSNGCGGFWLANDWQCLAGAAAAPGGPGALLRGGSFGDLAAAGAFAILGDHPPTDSQTYIGFRCAREL
jgi:hypothetical protein